MAAVIEDFEPVELPPHSPDPPPLPWAARQAAAVTAAAGGLRRALSATEAAAGMEPLVIRDESERAVSGLLRAWEPAGRAIRQDLAEQVAAAVDGGHLGQLAGLRPDTGPVATMLTHAMQAMAWTGAQRLVKEAAAQGVTIPLSAVHIDDARLARVAEARAALIGTRMATEATRTALRVVQASAGTDAGQAVAVHLDGLSPTPLADQLAAAMNAAQNMGRVEAMTAGIQMGHDPTCFSSEILDGNTCLAPSARVTTECGQVRVDQVTLADRLLTHAGRWVQPSRIVVSESKGELVRVNLGAAAAEPLRVTPDHPVLVCERSGALVWREAGQLAVGDFIVHESALECGREIRPPDLGFRQPPHDVAAGGQVRCLSVVHVRAQGMPVGAVRLNDQVSGHEVDDPRADLHLGTDVVAGGGQRQPNGALDAGFGTAGPVAADRAEPLTALVRRDDAKLGVALGAADRDGWPTAGFAAVPAVLGPGMPERRAAPGTRSVPAPVGKAAFPGAAGVPVGVGDGHLEVLAAVRAGLGHPVSRRPELGAYLGVSELAPGRAVDRSRPVPAGDFIAAGLACWRGPAGRALPGPGGTAGTGPAQLAPADRATAARTHSIHGFNCIAVTGVSREPHAGPVYDFTIPGDETFWAEGVLVHNCSPCRSIDGHQFPDVQAAESAYVNGGFVDCEGLERCRGTIVVTWEPAASTPLAPVPAPEPASQKPTRPGQHFPRPALPPLPPPVPPPAPPPPAGPQAAGQWREEQHPRGYHGRFGHGTNPGKGGGKGAATGLAAHVATGIKTEKAPASAGKSGAAVAIATLGDGTKVIHKTGMSAGDFDHEQLAGAIADAIGNTGAPPIIRPHPGEAYIGLVPGEPAVTWMTKHGHVDPDPVAPHDDLTSPFFNNDRAMRIGLLDLLAGNEDRHWGNWFIDGDNPATATVSPIDHGLTLGAHGRPHHGPLASPFMRALLDRNPGHFTTTDLDGITARLDALAPQFAVAGHPDWHQQVMANLASFRQYAGGQP